MTSGQHGKTGQATGRRALDNPAAAPDAARAAGQNTLIAERTP